MKKILVIGGTGTMGKPLVDKLYNLGYEVDVICRHKINDIRKIKYHVGDAKNLPFMERVLHDYFDAIVDFCWYDADEFKEAFDLLIRSTDHYVCLSSAAVYADINIPKSEDSPRYMEVDPPGDDKDKFHLYCYEKARIEDMVISSGFSNWTIIRPGITLNKNHFFWGAWIDETFISRIILGQHIVVPDDFLEYKVSLTYGADVADMIYVILSNSDKSKKEIFNVTSTNVYSWGELLEMYRKIFMDFGYPVKEKHLKNSNIFITPGFWEYQFKRIKLLDRRFDSSKIYKLGGVISTPIEPLLKDWCFDYINKFKKLKVRKIYIEQVAKLDRITIETTPRKCFATFIDYSHYLVARYIPKLISAYCIFNGFLSKYK